MARGLTPLGHARVYRDPRNGELVVDADTLRRTSFAGEEPGDDDFGEDDDVGEDDDFGEDDDVSGDDDESLSGDDDFEGDEVGRRPRRRNNSRKKRRGHHRQAGQHRRQTQRKQKTMPHQDNTWGMTAVSGTTTLTAGGAASVTIRLQHHFKAKDITFDGSAAGAKVTSIFFGDRAVWSNSAGIPVSVFGSSSFMRNLLKGQSMHSGLDIVVNGALKDAGEFSVTLLGFKPVSAQC